MTTEPGARLARPYTLTGGRTKPRRNLPLHGLVLRTQRGLLARATLRGPAGDILDVCDEPMTILDVAAVLRLPVGVARVLVDDLVADRLVHVRMPAEDETVGSGRLERSASPAVRRATEARRPINGR